MTVKESYQRWYYFYRLSLETNNKPRAIRLQRIASKAYKLYSKKRGF